MDNNWLCNPPMILKLYTLTPHKSKMCPIDFWVKRSKVTVMGHCTLKMVSGWKWFLDNNWLCNPPMIMKLIHLLPMSQGCALLISGSKGQVHGALIIENGFRTITDSVMDLWSCNFIHLLLMSQRCALLIMRRKGQGHGAFLIESGFQMITDSVIHLWSCNFIHLLPMSQGCTLLILGSKVKVKVMGHWWLKMVSGHKFTLSMIMKLHESRIYPIDFWLKRSWGWWFKTVSGR